MRLSAKNICYKYNDGRWILKNAHFSIERGEVVGLTAPSGYGKTTLGKILAGYQKPQQGTVQLEGYAPKKGDYSPVQLVLQHPEKAVNPLWKMRKIIEEVHMPSKDLMDAMGIDETWLDRWPTELSGGELQRFCVLRVLNNKTKFIIADEMTSMLDAITQAQIWSVVLDYAKTYEIGIVAISHEKQLLNKICHRMVELETATNP